MNKNFVDFMGAYRGKRLAVGVSGGVDSVCLLCWLAQLRDQLGCHLVALHVNHGLRPAAGVEAAYVQSMCAARDIDCHVLNWTGDKPVRGLESAARTARYSLMTDFCRAHGMDALVIAHQADDQIETFLMNLARGSGISGLAAMRPVTVRDGVNIVRPLLHVSRREIQDYCDAHNIRYFHDEMNDDARYTRVRIRQNRHVLRDALGISDARLLLAIDNLGRTRDAVDTDIAAHVAAVTENRRAEFSETFLFDLTPAIRLQLLGTLIKKIGGDDYPPRLKSLALALDKLRNDCKFTLGHCTVRRLNAKILIVPEGGKTSFRKRNEKHQKAK